MEGTRNDLFVALCGGCGMHVRGVHRCPVCDTHMHTFYSVGIGEENFGQKRKFPRCS